MANRYETKKKRIEDKKKRLEAESGKNEKEELGGSTTTNTTKPGTNSSYSNDADVNQNSYTKQTETQEETKKAKTLKYESIKKTNIKSNELEKFRSMQYIWSLYCLTNEELRDPDNTYMVEGKEPNVVLIKGGGGTGTVGKRKATTSLERKGGRVEYFINSVTIDSVITPNGRTRMNQMHQGSFTVIEPYSMGQFLEAAQIAAQMAGHKTYIGAPFLLTVEFIGHTDVNTTQRVGKRQIPMIFGDTSMSVDASGSVYECTFISWNSTAYTNSVIQIPHDITIVGNQLSEILQSGGQSLTTVLNTTLLKREEEETRTFADEYVILFPREDEIQSKKLETQKEHTVDGVTMTAQEYYATVGGEKVNENERMDFEAWFEDTLGVSVKRSNISEAVKVQALQQEKLNDIGKSKLVGDSLQGGEILQSGYGKVYDPEKKAFEQKSNYIPADKRAFKFEKGTKITNIIEEMVLQSEYGKELLNKKVVDGFRPWFMVQSMVFNVPVKEVEDRKGRQPKIYVFRVLPYRVHASVWMSPSDVAPDTTPLLVSVNKEYNYLYTGKNKNVLNFDLKFNYRFLTPTPLDKGDDTLTKQNPGGNARGDGKDLGNTVKEKEGNPDKPKVPLKPLVGADVEVITSGMRAVPQDTKDVIARTFHKALVYSNADMVQCDLEIMGDPYFLSDSGTGNYQSAEGTTWFEDENGQIDHVRSNQYIIINFRTPFDYASGQSLMQFPTDTDESGGMVVREFSGLYQVMQLQHIFESGQFRQSLKLNRMLNQQDLDTKEKGSDQVKPTEDTGVESTAE